ncbi:1-phosphofructokinase family hexose kinase [Sphingomonas sp.]|uniref:1-phosphofructokinase family hexose kinase n=1 Tax=Sphingomonas sp. TaxID=28214 RepID=UPI00286DA96C|nr:1-phosphofructokinase family hexose kinase [Sphingomonas sp.]
MSAAFPAPPAARIATLTLNPSIDNACEADAVRHTQKTRTFNERMDPGGGGINVARVLGRVGADVNALYLAGGFTGRLLDELLERERVARTRLAIADDTRLSVAVYERSTGVEYRFVPEGPEVADAEWRACLEHVAATACDYLVASGSLPRGVPDDFYVQLAQRLPRTTRLVLDTSGEALREALAHGGLFMIKPSRGEFEELVGRPLPDTGAIIAAAADIVARGGSELVAVTLGRDGAVLATPAGAAFVPALAVDTRSAVGAGDSFLAAMVYGLAAGVAADDALRLGIAAGAAAALTPGTDLAFAADIERLYAAA